MRVDRFWVVTDSTGESTMGDICFEASLRELELQFKGGLTMDRNPALFTEKGEAEIDTSTPTGEFFRNVMASLAQLEGRIIADRLSKGRQRKAARGGYVGGWLPYGYEYEDGRVRVVPAQAAVVRRIFRWSGEGRSLRWIAGRLESRGAPTQNGGKWRASTVRGILRNPTYRKGGKIEGLRAILIP